MWKKFFIFVQFEYEASVCEDCGRFVRVDYGIEGLNLRGHTELIDKLSPNLNWDVEQDQEVVEQIEEQRVGRMNNNLQAELKQRLVSWEW